jgi:hypothetical protein
VPERPLSRRDILILLLALTACYWSCRVGLDLIDLDVPADGRPRAYLVARHWGAAANSLAVGLLWRLASQRARPLNGITHLGDTKTSGSLQ